MNHNVLNYTDCCSKLEKIASKKRIYGSESAIKLSKKDSKNESGESILKDAKGKNKKIPFVCGSASRSHHIGINLQTTMSIIKQFPGQSFDDQTHPSNSTGNLFLHMESNGRSETSLSRQFSEMNLCPAVSEERFAFRPDDSFDGTDPNPWAVKQFDRDTDVYECVHQKSVCTCPTRSMDGYYKVMAPFIKHLKRKQKSSEAIQNPYTKGKEVRYYESLARHMQELKQTMMTMNNGFLKLTEKYMKLYDQYTRSQDGKLIPILLATEDELNDLKSKVEEAVDVYKEAAFVNAQEQQDSSDNVLAEIEAEQDRRPKETTAVRLAKVLRRVQSLQEKLKTGHFLHGSGDHAAE